MKFSLIRPASMLAMALALASCGGGDDDTYTVSGTVEGLVYPNLVMTNNGGDDVSVAPPAKPGDPVTFTFSKKLEYGDTYLVAVKTPPLHQSCGIDPNFKLSAADTAGRLGAINARFRCYVDAHAVGGKITGLTKDNTGLELANGSTSGKVAVAAPADNTTGAAFDYQIAEVPYGETYSIVVITQPTGRFCTVQNPAGTMGDAAVTNVNINCVPR